MALSSIRVLVVRGQHVSPWELDTWRDLPPRFDVRYLMTRENKFEVASAALKPVHARTATGFLPSKRLRHLTATFVGDRYIGVAAALRWADIVHAEELSYWFSADMARKKCHYRYKLVQSIWETIPNLDSFRTLPERLYRRTTIARTDRFLAVTERAKDALRLEGIADQKIELCPPGLDLNRFRRAAERRSRCTEHVILSVGRLVWEKGHQDVLRALAALDKGLIGENEARARTVRAMIVGTGREEGRLKRYATELGVADRVTFVPHVGYDQMPDLYANASCLVLASLPRVTSLIPGRPRHFWEEQFGMVLPEAMASGLPIIASTCGAISEVTGGSVTYFAPGDWEGLARRLSDGPLRQQVRTPTSYPAELLNLFSSGSAASRLANAYDRTLA